MGPHQLDLGHNLFGGLEEDGRVAARPGITVVNHVLGLGLAQGHALVGGRSGRVRILDLGDYFKADLLGVSDCLRRAVPAPGGGAVYKTDPGLARSLVVLLDPLHEDHQLMAIGGPQGIVIGVLCRSALGAEEFGRVGAVQPGDLLLDVDLLDQRFEAAGDVTGGHQEFIRGVFRDVLVEIGHFHRGHVAHIFQEPGYLLAVHASARAIDPLHAVDITPSEFRQGSDDTAHGKLGQDYDTFCKNRAGAYQGQNKDK